MSGPRNVARSRLRVPCWCERRMMNVPAQMVRDGLTAACRLPECKAIEAKALSQNRAGYSDKWPPRSRVATCVPLSRRSTVLYHGRSKRTLSVVLVASILVTITLLFVLGQGSASSTLDTMAPLEFSPRDEHRPAPPGPSTTTTVAPSTTTTAAPRPQVTTTTRPKTIAPKAPVAIPPPSGGVNAFLNCVARFESGDNYRVGPAGRYGILVSTWQNRTLGYSTRYGTSTAGAASPAAQDAAAMDLYRRYGSKPWSTRGRCGG